MQNPLRELSTGNLQEIRNQLSGELSDPLTKEKSLRLNKLKAINSELFSRNLIPYFCDKCHFQHKGGQIYHDHKNKGHLNLHFPPVKNYFPEKMYSIELDNTSLYNVDEELISLPTGTIFELSFENDYVIIKYKNKKLGNLNISHRKYEEINQMLNRPGVVVKCFLTHYQPQEVEKIIIEKWKGSRLVDKTMTTKEQVPEQLKLTITIFDAPKYQDILRGLVELIEYHPDTISAFIALGIRGMEDLEVILQEKKNSLSNMSVKEFHTKILEILDELHQYFKLGPLML